MNRSVVPSLLLLTAIVASCGVPSQEQKIAAPDSLMETRLREGWQEIRAYWNDQAESDPDGILDPQWHLASEFFDYYVAHSTTPTGIKAGETAFMMWGNLPAADSVESRIPLVGDDSPIWPDALLGLGNTYFRSDRSDDFRSLLHELKTSVTLDESRSAVHMQLASYAQRDQDTTAARGNYETVIELDANVFDVQKAESALYELDILNIGQFAPDIDAVTIDGEHIRLANLRGKVVLVEFWATTCGPCMPLIPFLAKMHEELPESEFALVGVTDDTDMEVLRSFLSDRGMKWPQIQQKNEFNDDGLLVQDPVLTAYNVFGIPRSFLIDRDGKIVAKDLRNEALDQATRDQVSRDA
jgi:thiol-disulfide isomerase/thioredoxin